LAASRTNRGHDITIEGVSCSLKTQADKGIKEDEIYIYKAGFARNPRDAYL
jgi:type II restriction enzyme